MHIHIVMIHKANQATDLPEALPCACANLRRAARAVTQLYDQELRGSGLRVTQFTLLRAIARRGLVRQGELGALLALDQTTLSRTLGPLRSKGWIRGAPGADRREKHWELTPAGRRQVERAEPLWERAQARFRSEVGEGNWNRIQEALIRATRAALWA
jgi:DNA-binding MarR family transcriptional regulator